MPELTIESNGRLEKTAIYFNGEQLDKIREIFLNLDESGTFDAVIQYLGSDGTVYTKNVFTDYLENVRTEPPGFTEEEAQHLQSVTLDSDGEITRTIVLRNGNEEGGIVSLFVHIKAPTVEAGGGIAAFFGGKRNIEERPTFKAEVVYREDDGSLTTESLF